MANLKIIWTTGKPFSPGCIDKIAYETSPSEWNVYRNGSWHFQSSSTGRGYRLATAEEIAEHWKVLHPKWTPEPGDRVIVTQDIGTWCNKRGTIVNADGSEYWIVKRDEDGRTCNFMKQNQMILAPYEESVKSVEATEAPEATSPESKHGFTIGDVVIPISDNLKGRQCIVKRLSSSSIGVHCPSGVGLGHTLDGHCPDNTGWWYHPSSLELVSKVEPEKQEPKEDDAKVLGLFSIGDKVIPRSGPFKHKKGSILCVNTKFKSLGVVFDSFEGAANSLDGQCEQGFGYYYTSVELTPDTSEGFSVGDTVKPTCGPYKGEVGTILCFLDSGRPGVFFEVRKAAGHNLGGYCAKDHGWFYDGSELTLVSAAGSTLPGVPKVPKTSTSSVPIPKEGYVTVRFFTEEEFKSKGLWNSKGYPEGWNNDGEMNKYLGTYIQLSKSKFDGSSSFRYEDWHFAANNYEVIHEGVETKPEPKPETTSKSGMITVRFFTETEFKAKDKWDTYGSCPKGWIKSMNGYLGQTVDIKKSDIQIDKGFHYHGWLFGFDDYEILTPGHKSKSSPKVETKVEPEVKPKEPKMKPQRFKVGDRVTYKSYLQCGGKYYYDGKDQKGFVGEINSYDYYVEEKGCYKIYVRTSTGGTYMMLESEFCEYDGSTPVKAKESKEPEKKFAVGDKVTYKSHSDLGGGYRFGGGDQGKKEGTVIGYSGYEPEYNCYKISVTTPHGVNYGMLESEFYEYDTLYPGAIFLGTVGLQIHQTVPKSKDDLSQYNQSPVLIHKKPTKRLVVVDAY